MCCLWINVCRLLVLVALITATHSLPLKLERSRLASKTPTVHITQNEGNDVLQPGNPVLEPESHVSIPSFLEMRDSVHKAEGHMSLSQTLETLERLQLAQQEHEEVKATQVATQVNSQPTTGSITATGITQPTITQVSKATYVFNFENDAIRAFGLDTAGLKPICCWARWSQSAEPHSGTEDFDGSSSYLALNTPTVDGSSLIGGGPMTFEVVVKLRSLGSSMQNIFDWGEGLPCKNNILMHAAGNGGNTPASLDFRVYKSGGTSVADPCDPANIVTFTVENVFMLNTWHYVVVTIDTTGLWSVYVDGGFRKSLNAFVPPSVPRSKILLGRSSWITDPKDPAQNNHMNGELDSLRLWKLALSAEDVFNLWDEQQPVNCILADFDLTLPPGGAKCYIYKSAASFERISNETTCLPAYWKSSRPGKPETYQTPPEPSWDFVPTPAYREVIREARVEAARGGTACPAEEYRKIKVDCELDKCSLPCLAGEWSDWSVCDKTCDKDGVDLVGSQQRRRIVLKQPGSSIPCPDNELAVDTCTVRCPLSCQVSEWSQWTSCTADCGRGQQSRKRNVVREANSLGEKCPALSQTQDCNTKACVRHCQITDWAPVTWGPGDCNAPCGNGTIQQTRTVLQQAADGGDPCGATVRVVPCNTEPCPSHCVVNVWGPWAKCQKDCGQETQTRTRTVKTPATFGGMSCPPLLDARDCGLQPCDYLAKLRNLKDRIRRLELQKRVEYLEHLHLLAKAKQILFPPTLPPISSTGGGGCPGGPCALSSSAAAASSSGGIVSPPPVQPTKVIKQPIVYIIDRPYVVYASTGVAVVVSSSTLVPVAPSSSAAYVPCSDGGCVPADVVEPCCPGHCCEPKPDLVEAVAVDHLDDCCEHASPQITCCVVPPPQTCCHWPQPHSSCCTVGGFPPAPAPDSDDSPQPTDEPDTCCNAEQPHPRCCSSFRQKTHSHVYPDLTDQEQLESVGTEFLQVR